MDSLVVKDTKTVSKELLTFTAFRNCFSSVNSLMLNEVGLVATSFPHPHTPEAFLQCGLSSGEVVVLPTFTTWVTAFSTEVSSNECVFTLESFHTSSPVIMYFYSMKVR